MNTASKFLSTVVMPNAPENGSHFHADYITYSTSIISVLSPVPCTLIGCNIAFHVTVSICANMYTATSSAGD